MPFRSWSRLSKKKRKFALQAMSRAPTWSISAE